MLGNLLPADFDERRAFGRRELQQLWRKFNRQFSLAESLPENWKPDPSSKIEQKVYSRFLTAQRLGTLMVEIREPVKRRRGRPAAGTYTLGFKVRQEQWRPQNSGDLLSLVRTVRQSLHAIAEATEAATPKIRGGQDFDWRELAPVKLPPSEYKPTLFFNVPDGRAAPAPDPYRQFIQTLEGLELFRIRRCPVCGAIFFAARKDKGACSPSCLNVYRVREFRKLGQQRRRQYEQARARKKKLAGVTDRNITRRGKPPREHTR